MSHGRRICEFGTIHSTCRCIDGSKSRVWIKCPTPDACAAHVGANPNYQPKHKADVESDTRID